MQRQQGDANAGVHSQLNAVHAVGTSSQPVQKLDRQRLRGGRIRKGREHHSELVSTEPGHRVARTHRGPETTGDLDEECVPRWMAKSVVDCLEPIEIDHQQGSPTAVSGMSGCGPPDLVAQGAPVQQSGQLVMVGVVFPGE